ncbi:hypothetical protein Hdeb2414_s0009g00322561 [Helianthus debilis subsp. tardiflorus]
MGARKDLAVSYLRLTQEEVETFCMEWGMGLKFKPVAPGMDVLIDQCPAEYYHVSFGQIHPQGLARVLHFEVLCRACGYDPTLLSFRRFFRLAKNDDWLTFETSKADICLVSSMVTMLGAWKDRFVWQLLVLLGISKLWDKPNRDRVIMRDGQVMSALEFIKSDDTSDVAFGDVQATRGEKVVVKGSEQRFEGSGYVGVLDVKGFKKAIVPKVVRHSNRRLNIFCSPSTPEHVGLSDDIGVSVDHALDEGVDKEKELVIAGKKSAGKGGVVAGSSSKSVSGSEGLDVHQIYIPDWGMKLGDSFKDATVCEDMDDDMMLSHMILSTCNVTPMLPQGVARFRKRMHEYEEFSKKNDKMKATMSTLKKENEGLVKREETLSKKVEELTQKHEMEVGELKKQVEALEASRVQLSDDNKWLIEHGFQQVVTYLLQSAEFNSVLSGVYGKLLEHGRHQGYVVGYKACQSGDSQDKSSLYHPEALKVFQDSVREMERLTYPYVGEVSRCFGNPISVFQDLKPRGLDEAVCKEVLGSLSKKRSCSGDSEDTLSCAGEGSKDPSLEASGTAIEEGKKKKKKKKAKKAKGDETGASKSVLGWLQAFKAFSCLFECSLLEAFKASGDYFSFMT